jgi:hypothetical protein
LAKLVARKCNFQIVFFDDHEQFCVPTSASPESRFKYLLARAALIRHLKQNLPSAAPKVLVKNFSSVDCKSFTNYLDSQGVYFVMCHDGSTQSKAQKAGFRWMIHWFIEQGYNAALINSLEFLDTKVMSMVLEFSNVKVSSESIPRSNPKAEITRNGQSKQDLKTYEQLSAWQDADKMDLSERELITLAALTKMIRDEEADAKLSSLFLLHTTLLRYSSLSDRRFDLAKDNNEAKELVEEFAASAYEQLQDPLLYESFDDIMAEECDTGDLIDARLFYALCSQKESLLPVHGDVDRRYATLVELVNKLSGKNSVPRLDLEIAKAIPGQDAAADSDKEQFETVMPFINPTFDEHLAPIHLSVDDSISSATNTSNKIFSELTHWHNTKPVVRKGVLGPKVGWWILRRNQYFMAEMIAYAASLTNASGKVLDPEVIISTGPKKLPIMPKPINGKTVPEKKEAPKKEAKPGKKGGPVKKGGKAAALEAAAAVKASKVDQQELRIFQAWEGIVRDLQKISDLGVRYSKAKKYLQGLSSRDAAAVGAEVELFMIGLLLELWTNDTDTNKNRAYAALIWDHSTRLYRNPEGLTKSIIDTINEILQILGITALPFKAPTIDRKLPFTMPALEATRRKSKKISASMQDLTVGQDPREFQLSHCGPYFDRSIDSAPDARVAFHVSLWFAQFLILKHY